MGCQNSRLVNPDILAIPPKLRPLLWRKAEEIRRRRANARASDALSKKELLMESHRREESEALPNKSNAEKECELPSLPDDDSVLNSATMIEEKSNDDSNNVASDEAKEEEKIIESHEDDGDDHKPNGIQVDEEITSKEEEKEKELEKIEEKREIEEEGNNANDDNNDDGDGDDDDGNERNIGPASPSFRVYYLESLKEKKVDDEKLGNEDKDKDENVNAIQEETSTDQNSNESIAIEDSNANEEQETTKIATKKEKNRKRITRAIRRGPVAMKNLLNVKSCYHPSNERASLLSKKTEQTVE